MALISFLLGMILAFQSAIPMKRFGAEIFVADLIGLAMLRELGPLMTAILLAGRSGAAFAAEIGTMRVTEQIDALATLRTDPYRYLIAPRLLAALIALPLLVLVANALGVFGGYLLDGFFNLAGVGQPGRLVEFNPTEKIFSNPEQKATEDYISGRFG